MNSGSVPSRNLTRLSHALLQCSSTWCGLGFGLGLGLGRGFALALGLGLGLGMGMGLDLGLLGLVQRHLSLERRAHSADEGVVGARDLQCQG